MPSITRLLVLAVLGVSLSVNAIPVPEASADVRELHRKDAQDVGAGTFADANLEDSGAVLERRAAKCVPNKFKNKRSAREVPFEELAHLFRRDAPEFIGWHGTNSDTAAFWKQQGQLAKPTKATGFFDFFDFDSNQAAGSSGADAENGPGVYVTDDKDIAIAFANNNAKVNKGTTAVLCAIFAKSSANWRTAVRKAFLPEALVGDSATASVKAAKETSRTLYLKSVVPGVSAANVVRFSLLNRSTKTGQLVLPAGVTSLFTAQCVATNAALPAGTSDFPAFSYNGAALRSTWDIAAEQTCSA